MIVLDEQKKNAIRRVAEKIIERKTGQKVKLKEIKGGN